MGTRPALTDGQPSPAGNRFQNQNQVDGRFPRYALSIGRLRTQIGPNGEQVPRAQVPALRWPESWSRYRQQIIIISCGKSLWIRNYQEIIYIRAILRDFGLPHCHNLSLLYCRRIVLCASLCPLTLCGSGIRVT